MPHSGNYQPAPYGMAYPQQQQHHGSYQASAHVQPDPTQSQPQHHPYPQQQQPQNKTVTLDTQHEDLIHDAQFDYYGQRLATASSDRTVKIWNVELGKEPTLQATLVGHEGPVWMVAWAHPQFGSVLASCSFDGSVIVWKESPTSSYNQGSGGGSGGGKQSWTKLKEHRAPDNSSVNAIAWAPFECGLKLACASSDGRVSILSCRLDGGDGQQAGAWESVDFHAHSAGCNAVSWAPVSSPNLLLQQPLAAGQDKQQLKLATGGCDNLVRMWVWSDSEHTFIQEGPSLEGHTDWVRDVCFRPSDRSLLVSCSQDRSVRVWRESNNSWTSQTLSREPFADPLWRLSWSTAGAQLAVAGGDNKVTLWVEDGQNEWEMIGTVEH